MKLGMIGFDLTKNFSADVADALGMNEYAMLEMNKEACAAFVKSKNYEGLNITSPFKTDALHWIDDFDDLAKTSQSVDAIKIIDGKTFGTNTDFLAFESVLKRHSFCLSNKKVLILGNGGTSKACQAVCKKQGASEIVIVDSKESEGSVSYVDCFARHLDSQVIINTSPIGQSPDIENAPISVSLFSQCELVIDWIYDPILTHLGFEAQELGIPRIIGLECEVYQMAHSFGFFTGTMPSIDTIEDILHKMIIKHCNIVLIGMPSAGKTTIGHLLSNYLDKPFVDLDDVVVSKANMSIPDIFAHSGEAGFRKLESMVAYQLSALNNTIIGTGGGTIKNKINMDYLRLNGIVIFIDRDLDKLISTDPNRPLSSSKEALFKLFEERYPLYKKYSNVVILNNDEIETTVQQIIEAFSIIAKEAIS